MPFVKTLPVAALVAALTLTLTAAEATGPRLPNPTFTPGWAAGQIGPLGGALTGTLPNPGIADGAISPRKLTFTPLTARSRIPLSQLDPPLNPIAKNGLLSPSLYAYLNSGGAAGFGSWTPPLNSRRVRITVVGAGGGGGGSGSAGVGAATAGGASTVDPVTQFTASQTTNALTVTGVRFGFLKVGQVVYSGGTSETILGVVKGNGNIGTYTVSVSQTLAKQSMTAYAPGAFMSAGGGAAGSATGGNTGGACVNNPYQVNGYTYIIIPNIGSELSLTGAWGENPQATAAASTPGGNGGGDGHGTGGAGGAAGNNGLRPGAGGGGAGGFSGVAPAGGGGQGCTITRVIDIPDPAHPPTFAWVAGAGGVGGAAGTAGFAGGNGFNGLVFMEAE